MAVGCVTTIGLEQARRIRDRDHPVPRALTEVERDACQRALLHHRVAARSVCEAALDATRIHLSTAGPAPLVARAIAYSALRQRASGIALGRHVFIRPTMQTDGALPLWLVVHEVTHVTQTFRDGLAPFLARYAREYARGRLRGLGDHAAYLAISYEQEARRVAGDPI